MGRATRALVALAGLLAAAALLLPALIGPTAAPSPPVGLAEAEGLASEIDGRLREVAAGIHSRAVTLKDLPRLQAAVATDAATVQDLTQEELAFRPQAGESIAIAQVRKDGAVEVLWRSTPPGGPAPQLDRQGHQLLLAGEALHLAEVVMVPPRFRAEELSGALAVSSVVDLSAAAARAASLGLGAALRLGPRQLALHRRPPDGGSALSVPLRSEVGRGAVLELQLPRAAPASRGRLGTRGVLGVALALAALLVGLLGGPGARPPAPAPAAAMASEVARRSLATGVTGLAPAAGGAPALEPDRRSTRELVSLGATAVQPSDPALIAASAADATPRQIGRYGVERLLGSGGMADVYLARARGEAGFEKLVALKVLHPLMARQPMIVDHFLDEARLASRLVHPNIVQISDLGRAGDDYYIAMEFVEGSDLERLLAATRARGEAVPIKVGFVLVRRILDGLHAAHIAVSADGRPLELVHRDVKSANIFVDKNGAVKVGDFGIAKANQEVRVARTEVGQVKGTAAYMAPEHRVGASVDARADQYSAAAIAYEVFSGQEINLDLVRLAHLGREGWPHLPPLTALRPELPPELDAVVFRALAYEREDRYPSCAAFEEALEACVEQHGLGAGDKAVAVWVAGALAARGDGSAAPGTPA